MKLMQKVVIKRVDKFLIILRSPDARHFPCQWDFSGGKLEANEEPFAGVEREAKEETGLKVKALEVVGVYEMGCVSNNRKMPRRCTLYSTKIISGL